MNQANLYSFHSVGGATAYQWQQIQSEPFTSIEDAGNGTNGVTVDTSDGYNVIASDVKYAGSNSFHLAQPDGANQYITLDPVLHPGASSILTFYKRLGLATTNQIAEALVSTDGGTTWQTAWSEPGSGGTGESSFSKVSVSLSAYAGDPILIRFAYVFTSGSYYPSTSTGSGFYFDAVSVSGANQLLSPVTNNVTSGTAFT